MMRMKKERTKTRSGTSYFQSQKKGEASRKNALRKGGSPPRSLSKPLRREGNLGCRGRFDAVELCVLKEKKEGGKGRGFRGGGPSR